MSIRQIRWFQRTCQMSFLLAALMVTLVIAAMFQLYQVSAHAGNTMSIAFIVFSSLGLILTIFLRNIRCPVCGYTFVGMDEKELFTHTCRNCGRHSGDFG